MNKLTDADLLGFRSRHATCDEACLYHRLFAHIDGLAAERDAEARRATEAIEQRAFAEERLAATREMLRIRTEQFDNLLAIGPPTQKGDR